MSFYDVVECPYCGHELDASEEEFDHGNEIDVECKSCGKEFEVVREWVPEYSSRATEDIECAGCGEMVREASHITGEILCIECACKTFGL